MRYTENLTVPLREIADLAGSDVTMHRITAGDYLDSWIEVPGVLRTVGFH